MLDFGADKPLDRSDLYRRSSLLFDELGMRDEFFSDFVKHLETEIPDSELVRWEQAVDSSQHAVSLIREFAAIEGDLSSHNPKGQGRMSGKAFPRLGSAAKSEAARVNMTTAELSNAIELTVHAGYLASLLLFPNISERQFRSREQIHREWILHAYQVPEQALEAVWSIAAFVEFWARFFEANQLFGAANALRGGDASSALVNSLSGLFGVGICLALEERSPDS